MLSLIMDYFLAKNRIRDTIVRASFFLFNGVLAGVTLNDLLRILFGEIENKEQVQYGISGAVAVAPYIWDRLTLMGAKSNNVFMGSGMALGTMFALRSADHKKVIPVPP